VVVTNTVATAEAKIVLARGRLTVLDVSDTFADAIERCHSGGSIVELLAEAVPGEPKDLH
jgi:phosphoribosylpyrophosphate synthetase